MSNNTEQTKKLSGNLKAARSATLELTGQLRRVGKLMSTARQRVALACTGGSCQPQEATGLRNGVTGGASLSLGRNLADGVSKTLGESVRGALRSLVKGLGKSLAGNLKQSAGGGLFGGLVGGLVGGGLDLLAGKLFPKRQKVEVENTVQANIMNFPRLSDLGFATNPASRLLGDRSVPRGPAFTVTVDYRNGAQDLIAAKVTSHLAQLNELHGRF